jgi:TRAP-type C4-dicarboxylate transport system permease large subunit
MRKSGYDEKLAVGSVAGAGGLRELIPPSTMLVLYAILSNQSVGKLLIAGFIPGIISALLLCTMIYFRCIRNRKLGTTRETVHSVKNYVP